MEKILALAKNNKFFYVCFRFFYTKVTYYLNRKTLKKNKKLKNACKGERCFIIGNGSSINQQDLKKLQGEKVFVCNHFYFHKDIDCIKPSFYSLVEPIMLNDSFRKNVFPGTIKKIDDYSKKNNETKIFLNIQHKKYVEENNLFSSCEVYYSIFNKSNFKNTNFDMAKPNPSGKGSPFFLLSLAYYMGFKDIYLIGFDYDHILSRKEVHFYDDKNSVNNTFLSNLEVAKDLCGYLENMEFIKNKFFGSNVNVFNAGVGGMTDTFPRIDFDSLF